jgi:hypothetical protein
VTEFDEVGIDVEEGVDCGGFVPYWENAGDDNWIIEIRATTNKTPNNIPIVFDFIIRV